MRSMDFEEYLWARGYDNMPREEMLEHMLTHTPFSPGVLKIYDDLFMDYCITGGMPRFVRLFVERNTFEGIPALQNKLVRDYEEDMGKYVEGLDKSRLDKSRLESVYRSIPDQLGRENKKFQASKVKKGTSLADYWGAIDWLKDAGLINISFAVNPLELPLRGNRNSDKYVLYFLDSGLRLSQLDEDSQKSFRITKNFGVYRGGLYENIIAEALVKCGYNLYYFKRDNSTLHEEFVVESRDRIIPVEARAGISGSERSQSLSELIKNQFYKDVSFGIKFVQGNIGYRSNICTFPHFCAFLTKDFLSEFNPD